MVRPYWGKNGDYVRQPEDNHRNQARDFICRSGYNYLDKLNKLFQLDKGDNAFLAQNIQYGKEIKTKCFHHSYFETTT